MHPSPSADDLLTLSDEAFVDSAFRALLGRAPEPEGRRAYLAQLRRGVPKERLLLAIADSAEARGAEVDAPDLGRLRAQLVTGPAAWLRSAARRLLGKPPLEAEGALAVVENRLGVRLQAHHGELLAAQARLQTTIDSWLVQQAALSGRLSSLDQRLETVERALQQLALQVSASDCRLAEQSQAQGDAQVALEGRLRELQVAVHNHQVALRLGLSSIRASSATGSETGADALEPAAVARVRQMLGVGRVGSA
jgi:hypothetical protein